MDILKELFSLSDEKYKDFHKKLIPTVDENLIIGIRTPVLRKFAKSIVGTADAEKFLNTLPHKYYDENCLHAFLIEEIKDFDKCVEKLEQFLPYIDNWATCDMLKPKTFKNNPGKTLKLLKKWLNSENTYTIRFAIVNMMMILDNNFEPEMLNLVIEKSCDEYYINMAVAWYLSIALIKQYDKTVLIFENNVITDKWVHNKALQKARESFRIDSKTKEYLKTLKR